MAASDRT